ncbi:MAG: DUF3179 domain-containing protein [Rhodospirillales bacterium]
MIRSVSVSLILFSLMLGMPVSAEIPERWIQEFPKTNFNFMSVDPGTIFSGGPPRDGIPALDNPKFVPVVSVDNLTDTEPVIGLVVGNVAKAYPIRILMWHEIVNDVIGDTPVTVTYCPLCNSAVVFDRRVKGKVLDFGTTGRLRNSDLVMYDRQTESWWQQFLGEAIIGELTGAELTTIPARLESFSEFKNRAPDGLVLVESGEYVRDYGQNPYVAYDSRSSPYPFFDGELPTEIEPMARVVVVEGQAWAMSLLREKREIQVGELRLRWRPGQNSALDTEEISKGRDVGTVIVTRNGEDAVYDVTFAFVFKTFYPDGILHTE